MTTDDPDILAALDVDTEVDPGSDGAALWRTHDTVATTPEEVDLSLDPLAGDQLHDTLAALRETHGPIAPCRFFEQPAHVLVT